ncbi:MAG: hypothetical protein HYU36_06795 [Planctomycetes bacterium]|nr:hypothetical protein [Planctomycetota bacterium]
MIPSTVRGQQACHASESIERPEGKEGRLFYVTTAILGVVMVLLAALSLVSLIAVNVLFQNSQIMR